jgi:uncharacterized protein YbbK (DUF523 family)
VNEKILVSECLYGGTVVRYDGKTCPCLDARFLRWKAEGRLVPCCPEVAGGLSVPRPPSERAGDKVISVDGQDVTAAFLRGAEQALKLAELHRVGFAIMKECSPSCGSCRIHDGTFSGETKAGMGVAVEKLRAAGIPVFSEQTLDAAVAYSTENL